MRLAAKSIFVVFAFFGLISVVYAQTETAKIAVDIDKPGTKISPTLWGIFFEDINLSVDGGLYAELIRNRNFEDTDKPNEWSSVAGEGAKVALTVDKEKPVSPKNQQSLKVTVEAVGQGKSGVVNKGYWGIPVVKDDSYELSLFACGESGFQGPLTVALESEDGKKVYAQYKIDALGPDWKNVKTALKANASDQKAVLTITSDKPGTFRLDMVSLFPQKTWKNRPGGWRPDLMQKLLDMKPQFVRFPGGCWVEGETMKEAYRWKETIGDFSERRTQYNIWGYYSTNGIGFHEYLQLSEDLGAEPLFVINCGMSHKETVPMDKMDSYIQDALDAIEYCNGPAESKWGAVRAKNGHPAPFNLKYLEIGNENGGPKYEERYGVMYKAIKEKYPNLNLVADNWQGLPKRLPEKSPVEISDEHYYNVPEFFIKNFNKYDNYDRKGPKIYVGEYAVTDESTPKKERSRGSLRGAIGESVFMMGMERNSDQVIMASYAPLFVHTEHRRWMPDLINYDNTRVYCIPSYYVQQMFRIHQGDVVLPVQVDTPEPVGKFKGGKVGVATWSTQAEYKDIKVVDAGDKVLFESDFSKGMDGWKTFGGQWEVVDGALRQKSMDQGCKALVGDPAWESYTLTLKARKIDGVEGFMIVFGQKGDQDNSWWNIGGWSNTQHGLEMTETGNPTRRGSVEKDRWYDVRVEVKPDSIKCFLDDKMIHNVKYMPMKSVYAAASRDHKTGEIIVKVTNVDAKALPVEIDLKGAAKLAGSGRAWVLTSDKPLDENSLDEPTKVAPKEKSVVLDGSKIKDTLPANSFSVIRVKAE